MGKGFAIHHKYYINGEKTHRDFTNRLEYYQYLEPIVIAEPKRFALVCNAHHQAITKLCRYNLTTFKRLLMLAKQSRSE